MYIGKSDASTFIGEEGRKEMGKVTTLISSMK
jgi:hypothetical protein